MKSTGRKLLPLIPESQVGCIQAEPWSHDFPFDSRAPSIALHLLTAPLIRSATAESVL
jgi:hypothetical protein